MLTCGLHPLLLSLRSYSEEINLFCEVHLEIYTLNKKVNPFQNDKYPQQFKVKLSRMSIFIVLEEVFTIS